MRQYGSHAIKSSFLPGNKIKQCSKAQFIRDTDSLFTH
jgi:hypothetical protein